MSDLTGFLLEHLAVDDNVAASMRDAVDHIRARGGTPAVEVIALELRVWQDARPRTNDDWRALIESSVRAQESARAELRPNNVGTANPAAVELSDAYYAVYRDLAAGYGYKPASR